MSNEAIVIVALALLALLALAIGVGMLLHRQGEPVYEIVHMKANKRYYALVNGVPLAWNRVTGQYVPSRYGWDLADSWSDRIWAEDAIRRHRLWADKAIYSKERVK